MSLFSPRKASRCLVAILLGFVFSAPAWPQSHGRITSIHFLGVTFGSHPDTVQLQIESGFSQGSSV